eukprot:gene3351-637_t
MASSAKFDLIVLGGGSGGIATAKHAANAYGKRVACVDFVRPSPPGSTWSGFPSPCFHPTGRADRLLLAWGLGGTCVNVGCIPKKLMHASSLIGSLSHDAPAYGWASPPAFPSGKPVFEWSSLRDNVHHLIARMNHGFEKELGHAQVTYYNMWGSLVDRNTILLKAASGEVQSIEGEHVVLAMGGRPIYPDIPGAKSLGVTSDDLFTLPTAPGTTVVVGASYVALECAGFLKGCGYDVTVLMRSIPLRGFDQQMAEMVCAHLETEGVKIIRGVVPTRLEGQPGPGHKKVFFAPTNPCAAGSSGVVITCTSAEFATKLALLERDYPGPHYVVFTSDLDPASGVPWCPDCVKCVPAAIQAARETGGTILEVGVGSRADWKSPGHPLRLSPWNLGGIPTLSRVRQGQLAEQVGHELESADGPAAQNIVRQFIWDNVSDEAAIECSTVLFAIGRACETSGIGLEAVGVDLDKGYVKVDNFERTSVPNIYAIGDIRKGGLELTPVAVRPFLLDVSAGRLLADRLFGAATRPFAYRMVPTTVFTPLEYGACGHSEDMAVQKFGDNSILVLEARFSPLEWQIVPARKKFLNMCYMKLLVDKATDKVVGFHYLGPNAGEITQGVAVAIKAGATSKHFEDTVGIHPTIAEGMVNLKPRKPPAVDSILVWPLISSALWDHVAGCGILDWVVGVLCLALTGSLPLEDDPLAAMAGIQDDPLGPSSRGMKDGALKENDPLAMAEDDDTGLCGPGG